MSNKKPLIAGIAIILLGTLGLGYWALRTIFLSDAAALARMLPHELELAKKSGIPLTPADLASRPVRDSDNAGPLYKKMMSAQTAFPSLTADMAELSKFLSGKITDGAATAIVKKHSRWIALAQQAGAKPGLDFRRDYSAGPEAALPEYVPIKAAATALAAKAILQARRKDVAGSLATLKAGRNIANHVAQEPLLIAQLVSMACEAIWMRGVREVVNAQRSNPRVLTEAAALVKGLHGMGTVRYGLSGESVTHQIVLNDFDRYAVLIPTLSGDDKPSGINPLLAFRGNPTWKDAFKVRALQVWREMFASYPEGDDVDFVGLTAKYQAIEARINGSKRLADTMNKILIVDLVPMFQAATKLEAQRELLRGFLAVHRFRRSHSRLPRSSSDLDHKYIDRYDGQPLRYRLVGSNGFVIYSIGDNLTDDGGSEVRANGRLKDLVLAG